jgi:preprotein translocase subunit SecE
MNEVNQEQLPAGPVEKLKLAAAVALLVAGLALYYIWAERGATVRWLGMVGGLVLALGMFSFSDTGRRFWNFALDSRIELRKVVWPTRDDTMKATLLVLGFVTIAGFFFWLLDLLLTWATNYLTGQGG